MLTILFAVIVLAITIAILYQVPLPQPWKNIIILVIVLLFVVWLLFGAGVFFAGPMNGPVILAPR